jgi:5-methylcytosine-specific restriction protein A
MPYKPKKPCAHPGCPKLTSKRYCDEHYKAEAKRYNHYERDPATDKRYTGNWKKIRATFLKTFPLCEICIYNGRMKEATIVHHRIPLADGGTNEWENLCPLCASCHSSLHTMMRDRFGK